MRTRIEINKTLIPYSFQILLGGEVWGLRVDYNTKGDMFTVSLYKNDELIHANEPLIYGMPLWYNSRMEGDYPAVDIIPWSDNREITAVTYDNFNETVFLVIDDQEISILDSR